MNENQFLESSAIKFGEALKEYPEEVALGVVLVLPNLANGCSWGFVNSNNEEFERVIPSIQANSYTSYYKISGGYLFSMNMDYLLSILKKTAGGFIKVEDLQIAAKHRQDALVNLEKFMKKGKSGKIGIFCLNDSPYITIDGVRHDAFCVTLVDLLTMCIRNGYKVLFDNPKLPDKVRNIPIAPAVVHNNMDKFIQSLMLAPSGNALLINVVK